MPRKKQVWDVIIIGAGPAGSSAAMVLARSRRNVLVIDSGNQRNLRSKGLHNFITRDGILPVDFLKLVHHELSGYNITQKKGEVKSVSTTREHTFKLRCTDRSEYSCKKLLLATGVTDAIPEIPGMEELWGSSVFHCPFCDGYECKDASIGLYSKLHNGFGMAMALRHLSSSVTLFTDGAFNLKRTEKDKLIDQGINIATTRISHLIHTKNRLKGIALVNGSEIQCTSLFLNHKFTVNASLLRDLGCLCTSKGAAITNRFQQTSVPGVYVAGDASFDMHFVVVAAAEGVKAAVAIHSDLLKESIAF